MKFTLVSRGGWGARAPRFAVATDADETYGHHSANNHRGAAGVRAIQNFHMDIRGWSDIAYNFLIDRRTLVVYEGRGWNVRPGSQRNYNTGTWSVCVMGDFRTAVPTQGLLATIAALIRHGENLGHIPRVLTGGHKDAPGQATTCPGPNLYARIPTIRNLLEDDMPTARELWDEQAQPGSQKAGFVLLDARHKAGRAEAIAKSILKAVNSLDVIDSQALAADIAAELGAIDVDIDEADAQVFIDKLIAELSD